MANDEDQIRAIGTSPGYAAWLATPPVTRVSIASIPGLVTYLPLDGSRVGHEMSSPEKGSKERPKRVEYRAFENLASGAKDARLGGDKDRVTRTVPGRVGQAQQLVGEETGTTYRQGQKLKLRIAEADPVSGSLRFELPEQQAGEARPTPERKDRVRTSGRRGRPPNIRHQSRRR